MLVRHRVCTDTSTCTSPVSFEQGDCAHDRLSCCTESMMQCLAFGNASTTRKSYHLVPFGELYLSLPWLAKAERFHELHLLPWRSPACMALHGIYAMSVHMYGRMCQSPVISCHAKRACCNIYRSTEAMMSRLPTKSVMPNQCVHLSCLPRSTCSCPSYCTQTHMLHYMHVN